MADDMRVFGVLACEGNPTGDSRMLALGGGRWPQMPLPLRRQTMSLEGHEGSVVVGSIDSITRGATGELQFAGKLFDTDAGRQCRDEMYTRYASSGLKYGVSIDPDDVMVELSEDEETMIFTSYRLRGATLVDIPAYNTAYVMLASQAPQAMVAAGAPRADLPRAWFRDPGLIEPTPLNVTVEGRVYGHAALWNSCHIAYKNCTQPPRSAANYAYFCTGVVEAEGAQIPVGHITMATGHASPHLGAEPAAEHYDNTGAVVADIVAGEDAHGIWFAGAIRDGITPEQVREMRAAAVSGDWRQINGNLEMVALLSVPVPGFPSPRVRAMIAGGQTTALLASACFSSEANVEDTLNAEAEVAETEPAAESPADVAEVAPEEVAAAMLPEEPAKDEVVEEDVTEGDDSAPEEEPAPIKMEDIMALLVDLQGQIAELKGARAEDAVEVEAAVVDPDAVPEEPLPAVENSNDDILAALDRLVNGPKVDPAALLAELDAKVG